MVPYSILIVDDDEKLCALLRSYFEQEQCLVYIANDGMTAVSMVRRQGKRARPRAARYHAARHGRL